MSEFEEEEVTMGWDGAKINLRSLDRCLLDSQCHDPEEAVGCGGEGRSGERGRFSFLGNRRHSFTFFFFAESKNFGDRLDLRDI